MVSARSLAVPAALAAASLALAACGTGNEPAAESTLTAKASAGPARAVPEPVQEKTEEAAKSAAQAEFDAYAAGDWKGAWDLWTTTAQTALPRDDYDRWHTTCDTLTGVVFEITNVRLDGDTTATVAWRRSIAAGTSTMRYEGGRWRYQPADDDMADYRLGVEALIEKEKEAGRCG